MSSYFLTHEFHSNLSFHILFIGMKERSHMDDVIYSPKEMFSTLALDYCNDEEDVMLPIAAQDLEHYAALNPN